MLTDKEKSLVAESRGKDPARVALSVRPAADVRPSVVAQQVDAYNRLADKVPTWAESGGLEFPFPVAIQQCSSEPLARFRQGLAADARSLIDLTGGLGVDCYFMGLGKERVTYVDANADAVSAARANFAILGADNTEFVNKSAEEFVQELVEAGASADLIFIDPSRRGANGERVYRLKDCSPDVTTLGPLMTQVARRVMIKLSPLIDISQAASELGGVTDVYAIGHGSECKDVVAIIAADHDTSVQPLIHAVTLADDGTPTVHISFSQSEERGTEATMATEPVKAGDYVFVPSAAMMKAGPFNILSARYGARLMARGTHIYVADNDVADFPGRRFRVTGVYDLSKKGIAELRKVTTQASIAVRNFPLTADALRRKLKMGESSTSFLFGATDCAGRPTLLLCEKVK